MNKQMFAGLAVTFVTATAAQAQVPNNCVETLFMSNNGGAAGGAVYYDMTLANATTFTGMLTNFGVVAGGPVGIEVYTCATTYVGNENDMSAWTLVAMDDGNAVSAGDDNPTSITFANPFMLPAGTVGIALVGVGADHEYTNGTGANQNYVSADGNIELDLGAATNVPFTGNIFTPRVWNGRWCSSGPSTVGTNYCTAVPNSTGSIGEMSAFGSASATANNLDLIASDLPANQFGIFVTSMTQAFVPAAGGTSNGNLCLGGALGRFTQPSQILNSGASGEFSLAVDTTMFPQGAGFVTVNAGETWNFQAWYRDPVGLGSNFTDGLEIPFN